MKRSMKLCMTILAFALCVLVSTQAQELTFKTIEPPGSPSSVWNNASGINNQGQIVGGYLDGAMIWHSYLFDNGTYTELDDPDDPGMGTALSSINDLGQMIGNSMEKAGADSTWASWGWGYGALFDRGDLTRILSIPNGKPFFTFGINNLGQITGTYGEEDWSNYWDNLGLCGFLLDGDILADIRPPDANATIASIVNDHGQIVGDYKDVSGKFHGFLYDNGDYAKIDFPGASESHAFGINNRGQIVGQYSDGSGYHGFLLDGDEFITIDHPDGNWTRANGINDHGQIVGNYKGKDGLFHGFMTEIALTTQAALSSRSKVSTTWARIKAE